jgi:hypothetical protein
MTSIVTRHPALSIIFMIAGPMIIPAAPPEPRKMLNAIPLFFTNQLLITVVEASIPPKPTANPTSKP